MEEDFVRGAWTNGGEVGRMAEMLDEPRWSLAAQFVRVRFRV